MMKYLLYFLLSGSVITASALLADKGKAVLGGILLVLPNMSIIAFFFINRSAGVLSTLQVVKASLLGTLVVWPIYMATLLVLIPKVGVNRSLGVGLAISIMIGACFVVLCRIPFISQWMGSG